MVLTFYYVITHLKEEEKTQKCFRTKGCRNSFTILVEYFTCKSAASGNFSTFSMSKNILAKYSAKILLEGNYSQEYIWLILNASGAELGKTVSVACLYLVCDKG